MFGLCRKTPTVGLATGTSISTSYKIISLG
jgi:hypothetical protein